MQRPTLPLLAALLLIASFSPVLAIQATDCKKGTFFRKAKCNKCPPGTYQDTDAATRCKKCPKGTFNIFKGAQGIDLCEPCKPNTFNNRIGAKNPSLCKRCPNGTVSVSGSDRCVTCPPGTVVSLGGAKEIYRRGYNFCRSRDCYPGNFPRRTRCAKCQPDSFSSKPNSLECERCRGGRFGAFALLGATKCQGCPPGMFCNRGRKIRPCAAYQFNDGTANCNFCPPGFQGNSQTGATSCVPCPSGTFKASFRGRCIRCTGGKVVVQQKTACITRRDDTACPSNFFKHAEGLCDRCNKQQRFNPTTKICEECPANQESNGGLDTTCQPCPPGSFRELGQEFCSCKPGWEVIPDPQVGCRPCPPGTFTSIGGASCFPCPAGTFAAKAGTAECKKCGFNFVQPLTGQTKCERCPRGMVPNPIRGCVSPATNCPAGTERAVDENNIAIACNPKTCPPDTFRTTGSLGSVMVVNCLSCRQRSRYDPGLNQCIQCPRNAQFSEGGTSTECVDKKCDNGFVQEFNTGDCFCQTFRELVNGECRNCGPGTFGGSRKLGCNPCPVGAFSSRERASVCNDCPLGSFSSMEGASACTPCPAGEVTLVGGSANCVVPGGLANS